MRILGVHGVGNHRTGESPETAADHLGAIWHRALSRGTAGDEPELSRADIAVAYYADALRPASGRQGADAGLDGLADAEEALIRTWAEQFAPPAGLAQGRGTAPLRQLIGWIAERQGLGAAATERFVAVFFREVARYTGLREDRPYARAHARAAVADAVRRHRPQVVLAHSLGSVVAYETLWSEPDLEIEMLVTLGSPLALPHAVFHRLDPDPAGRIGARRPPGVRRWVNIADRGDLVALPMHGVRRSFAGLDDDLHDSIHAFDFHRAVNYLACQPLGGLLRSTAEPSESHDPSEGFNEREQPAHRKDLRHP